MPLSLHRLSHATRSRAAVRQLLCWLVLALLLAPTLGRIHQVVHPAAWHGAGDHAHGQVVQGATDKRLAGDGPPGYGAPDHGAAGHWLLALFAGHSHSDCQLHDQLNAWAGPPISGPVLPAVSPQEPPRLVQARAASAGSAAFFDPRAPPAAAA
ncbi:MAG: hypothetical protein ABWY08_04565 [Comamonas sp.]